MAAGLPGLAAALDLSGATRFDPRRLNRPHAFHGVGATLGPIMTAVLSRPGNVVPYGASVAPLAHAIELV